jgi:hypothetical protein
MRPMERRESGQHDLLCSPACAVGQDQISTVECEIIGWVPVI